MASVKNTPNSAQFFVPYRFERDTKAAPYLGPNNSFFHGNWSFIFRNLNFQAKASSLGQFQRCVNSATSNGEVAQACFPFRHGRFEANRAEPNREVDIDPIKISLRKGFGHPQKGQVTMRTELTTDGIDGEET